MYIEWKESSSLCILYIDGEDYYQKAEAAEQVLMMWQSERRSVTDDESKTLLLDFKFSSLGSKLSSIKEPLGSLLLAHLADNLSGASEDGYELLADQFRLHHTWNDQDLLRILRVFSTYLVNLDTLLVLEDMDECHEDSRQLFWKTLNNFATNTERPMKVVITCKKSDVSLSDLNDWPGIPVRRHNPPAKESSPGNTSDAEQLDGLLTILCPGAHGEAKIREALQGLVSMDRQRLEDILRLIQSLSNWPKELSARALERFCSLLERVSLSSKPPDILNLALRDLPDQSGVQWVLGWMLYGYRPLTLQELSQAFCYCQRDEELSFDPPSRRKQQRAFNSLQSWIGSIAETNSAHVHIAYEVESLLKEDLKYVWSEIELSESLLHFVLGYLIAPQSLKRLQSMFKSYLAIFHSSGHRITPPLIGDGEDIIFYAIESLPYHLSKVHKVLSTLGDILVATNGKLGPWSQVYWAMSNPFSRPQIDKLNSPCDTLLALSNLDPATVEILKDFQSASKPKSTENECPDVPAMAATIDSLVEAMRMENENLALSLAKGIFPTLGKDMEQQAHQWDSRQTSETLPTSFLWRATWLDMPRLVTLLLENTSQTPVMAHLHFSHLHYTWHLESAKALW